MMERKEECAASAEAEKKKNKRRFSDEQIRLLESIFESESTTKFEPRKKMQVARELGLQPRQVAIWFQNKRARRKSKQIELDYAKLRANYDCLASGFESLIKEKESLLLELQMLNEQLGKSDVGIEDLKRSDKGRSNKGTATKFKPEILEEGLNKHKGFITSQNNNNNNSLNNTEQCVANEVGIDDSTASSAKWFNDSGDCLLDPSTSSSSQWLNFSWI